MSQPNRGSIIRAIKTGQRSLGLKEDEYRAFLVGQCGKMSCTDMNTKELQQVLFAMRKIGFRTITPPQVLKIRAVWHQMHTDGIVRSNADAAINAYVQRICKYPMLECSTKQLQKVIESLKAWIFRVENENIRARLLRVLEGTEPVAGLVHGVPLVEGCERAQ